MVYGVAAIMEKPRTFFVLNGPAGNGMPAFQSNGKVVGLLTIRQIDPGRMSMFGMMGGTAAPEYMAPCAAGENEVALAPRPRPNLPEPVPGAG